MSTSTEQIVWQIGDFLNVRNWDAIRQCLTDNVTYHIPGKNPISGTYRGIDEVLTLLTRWADRIDEVPMSSELLQTSRGDQRVVMILQRTAMVDGVQHQWIEKLAHFFNGRQVAACWLFVDNQTEFDAYWSFPLARPHGKLHTHLTLGGAALFSVIA